MRRTEVRWQVAAVPPAAQEQEIPRLAQALGVPRLAARLLWLRGHRAPENARRFLVPRLADLESPDRLPDVARVGERLARAVREGERIAVFGDYDVDGMTGTALLVRFFRMAGADVTWAIPDRTADGYGLAPPAVDQLADAGVRVVVTVDNGIAAHEAVERAAQRGLDVVITDHHLPGPELPDAFAVMNTHRTDASGVGRDLCGCALAFKTAWAVADRLRQRAGTGAEHFRAFLRDAMGLVALATISDVVPLRGENRILVTAGLAALRASQDPGVRALLETSRLGDRPLTTEDVAFRLAPRLNAAGRLSKPELVIDLLTATAPAEAHRLARCLANANTERRRIEQGVLAEAVAQADDLLLDDAAHSLVVHGDGWHRGVIGIVAARLVDRHHRPTIVIGFDGEGGRGSGRAPKPVDLHAALSRCNGHLTRYGGHAAAAGLDIDRERVADFRAAFEVAIRQQNAGDRPVQTLEIDGESTPDDWDLDTVEAIQRLAPFGASNPEPLFLVRGAAVAGRARLMGQGDAHLSFAVKQRTGAIRVVAFRMAAHHDLVASGRPLDLVVTPTTNAWRGVHTPELRLVDVREHDGSAAGP